jgi:spore germination cell wall hydrolase CwlJ-like protein
LTSGAAETKPSLDAPKTLEQLVATRAAHPRPLKPDVECLARTVYREASNQGLRGQLAVAQVILNRVKSGDFANTVCGVVQQPGQFSHAPMPGANATSRPWTAAVAISAIAEEQQVAQVAPGALFFHASYVRPSWSQNRQRIAQIGDHIFYR